MQLPKREMFKAATCSGDSQGTAMTFVRSDGFGVTSDGFTTTLMISPVVAGTNMNGFSLHGTPEPSTSLLPGLDICGSVRRRN